MQYTDISRKLYHLVALVLASLALSGCLDQGDGETSFDGSGGTPSDNASPVISGSPAGAVIAGDEFSFTPTASDPDGDKLTFEIQNRPQWAQFDTDTGTLSGQPTLGNVGVYQDIRISVSDGTASAALPRFTIRVTPDDTPPNNTAPQISGNPAAEVNVGDNYSFTPDASDADNDNLAFSVTNLPRWANFNMSTGRISGTPGVGDEDTYTGISITVTDGLADASLGPFSITVNAVSLGSVTLNWTAPTENEDGTALTDLDGYKIYWGTTPGSYPNSVRVDNEGLTTYVVDNLVPGTYEFVATSFNVAGVESVYSNPATKVVN